MNVGLAVARTARRYPTSLALLDGRRGFSYLELDRRTAQFGNLAVERFGLARGDRVALLVSNRREVVEVLAGSVKAGLVYCGLNFRMTPSELQAVFDNAEPRLLVTENALLATATELSRTCGVPLVNVDDAGPTGYEALLAQASGRQPDALHQVRPEDNFCIIYTSGTTGRPKGILFNHAAVLQHATVACMEYELDRGSRYLVAIPHNSSVNITLVPCLMVGAAMTFSHQHRFDAAEFVAEVEHTRATHTYLVPTQLYRVLEQVPVGKTLPTLQTIGYGASPIPPDRVRELLERFGPVFNQLYGMAEIASIGTMLRKHEHVEGLRHTPRLLASCGQASYVMDVRVVDDAGQDVPAGERGEVIFGGPYSMSGYFRDPIRTAETLRDGWIYSGDVAEMDEDGYLYIVDRKKDLIIRGGYNIAPTDIENVLYGHPAVLEAAAIGVPDPEWGESVLAVVAFKDGLSAEPSELIAWCQERGLPSVKIPQRIEILDTLPKNGVGKIVKRDLRDRYWLGTRKV